MSSFRVQQLEVPEILMGTLSSRDLSVQLRLCGMDQIRELYEILNEEDWNIIPDYNKYLKHDIKQWKTYPTISQLPSSA